jgi:hypothetical protein
MLSRIDLAVVRGDGVRRGVDGGDGVGTCDVEATGPDKWTLAKIIGP